MCNSATSSRTGCYDAGLEGCDPGVGLGHPNTSSPERHPVPAGQAGLDQALEAAGAFEASLGAAGRAIDIVEPLLEANASEARVLRRTGRDEAAQAAFKRAAGFRPDRLTRSQLVSSLSER